MERRQVSRIRVVKIECAWDEQAQVWYVEDSNLPGLALEAPTQDAMNEQLKLVIPDLLQAYASLRSQRASKRKSIPARVQFNEDIACASG